MSETCPFCGVLPRAVEEPGAMNQNPPYREFLCGSTYFSKTNLYQSWACRQIAALQTENTALKSENATLKEHLEAWVNAGAIFRLALLDKKGGRSLLDKADKMLKAAEEVE